MPRSLHLNTHVRAGTIIYGTLNCPWTIKQREYFDKHHMPYEFVDCTQNECPKFVEGYPTLVLTGYQEVPVSHR
jgi:hypothetical protein